MFLVKILNLIHFYFHCSVYNSVLYFYFLLSFFINLVDKFALKIYPKNNTNVKVGIRRLETDQYISVLCMLKNRNKITYRFIEHWLHAVTSKRTLVCQTEFSLDTKEEYTKKSNEYTKMHVIEFKRQIPMWRNNTSLSFYVSGGSLMILFALPSLLPNYSILDTWYIPLIIIPPAFVLINSLTVQEKVLVTCKTIVKIIRRGSH